MPTKQVTLYLKDKRAATDPTYNILWCIEGSSCINEAVRDPSLATRHAPRLGFIFRRIKHFSGYNVALGRQR